MRGHLRVKLVTIRLAEAQLRADHRAELERLLAGLRAKLTQMKRVAVAQPAPIRYLRVSKLGGLDEVGCRPAHAERRPDEIVSRSVV